MPAISRWFIKAGLVYFLTAMLLAIGLKAQLRFPALRFLAFFNPVYYHLLTVGWITQIIMGVSHWMFPRFSREMPRGNEALAWLVFVLLNAGLLMRLTGEPLMVLYPAGIWDTLLILSAVLQWLAGALYIRMIWPRLKGKP